MRHKSLGFHFIATMCNGRKKKYFATLLNLFSENQSICQHLRHNEAMANIYIFIYRFFYQFAICCVSKLRVNYTEWQPCCNGSKTQRLFRPTEKQLTMQSQPQCITTGLPLLLRLNR